VVPLPITTLEVLTVGRVLKEEPTDEQPVPPEEPASEQRFLGSEWSIDLWFGSSETSIASLDALGLRVEPLPARYGASPLCVSADPGSGRLVLIPCWEIFRFYYASAPGVARLVFEFPRWKDETLEPLLLAFDGHSFTSGRRGHDAPKGAAVTHLRAIGRDAAVSFARRGRAQIRSVPPFAGPATLEVVGLPAHVGGQEALFVQRILASRARPEGSPRGTSWRAWAVPPAFRSGVEYAAWWAMYHDGELRQTIVPALPSWEAFVWLVERNPGLVQIREYPHTEDPSRLRDALLRLMARPQAGLRATRRGPERRDRPARGGS
jgi:hypothetical protein